MSMKHFCPACRWLHLQEPPRAKSGGGLTRSALRAASRAASRTMMPATRPRVAPGLGPARHAVVERRAACARRMESGRAVEKNAARSAAIFPPPRSAPGRGSRSARQRRAENRRNFFLTPKWRLLLCPLACREIVERQPDQTRGETPGASQAFSPSEPVGDGALIPAFNRAGCSACVAQLVEHVLGKDEVTGSIPVAGSASRNFK